MKYLYLNSNLEKLPVQVSIQVVPKYIPQEHIPNRRRNANAYAGPGVVFPAATSQHGPATL